MKTKIEHDRARFEGMDYDAKQLCMVVAALGGASTYANMIQVYKLCRALGWNDKLTTWSIGEAVDAGILESRIRKGLVIGYHLTCPKLWPKMGYR